MANRILYTPAVSRDGRQRSRFYSRLWDRVHAFNSPPVQLYNIFKLWRCEQACKCGSPKTGSAL